ncbi:MAG TPA: glycosyl hydrolase family 8, partial [Mycobacteriales bacterium]|nr:glycosyl hydrolase family 8 [Mycobacteriales bacterium]
HGSVPGDVTAARRVATAVANSEIGYDDEGRPTLAAGPWAMRPGSPVRVEPGYWTFPADVALAALTHDHRWDDLPAADATHLAQLADGGRRLPPDWARLGGGTAATDEPAPQTGSPPASGDDGLRAVVWAACSTTTHALDARWWRLIAPTAHSGALSRNLDGAPADSDRSPLRLVAAAAAAISAGQQTAADALLDDAARVAAAYPTYYGDAWNALGHVLLTTDLIPGCSR